MSSAAAGTAACAIGNVSTASVCWSLRTERGLPAPIARAGNRPLYLIQSEDAPVSGDQAVTVTPGVVLAVSFSSDVSVDCRVQLFRRDTLEPLGGEIGSASARSFQLPDGADGAVLLNILCTYEDGGPEAGGACWRSLPTSRRRSTRGQLRRGQAPSPPLPRRRGTGRPSLPAPRPADWAGDETAARDSAVTLGGIDGGLAKVQAGFTTSREGWAVVSIGTGVGWADIYFYRSHDGGSTGPSHGRPEPPSGTPNWPAFPTRTTASSAWSFNGAPIFTTADGGRTWEALDVSRIYADVGDPACRTIRSIWPTHSSSRGTGDSSPWSAGAGAGRPSASIPPTALRPSPPSTASVSPRGDEAATVSSASPGTTPPWTSPWPCWTGTG